MIHSNSTIPGHLRIRFWRRWQCRFLWLFATAKERHGCIRIAQHGGTFSFRSLRMMQSTVQSVYVRCLPINDQDLEAISLFENCEGMDLGGTQITDEGVRLLTRMPKLRYLFLWHTGVTDSAANILVHFSQLRMLSLQDTLVTDQALTALNEALPNCLICPDESRYLYGKYRDKDAFQRWIASG